MPRYYIEIKDKSSIDGESIEFSIEETVIKVTYPTKGVKVQEGQVVNIGVQGKSILCIYFLGA